MWNYRENIRVELTRYLYLSTGINSPRNDIVPEME